MAKDVQELFTPDGLWRARLNAWKTHALFFHEVGASILVDKRRNGRWLKTPEATIHLIVLLTGRGQAHVYHDQTHSGAGYRDWRVSQWGTVVTFGSNGIGVASGAAGVNLPDSNEPIRLVEALGDVAIRGYSLLKFDKVCAPC